MSAAVQTPVPAVPAGQPMTDILPIRPPVDIPVAPPWWVWGAVALAAAAIALIYFWLRKRDKSPLVSSGPPPVPAHVRAGSLLRQLDEQAARLSDREFYIELTGIFRGFLEDRFHEPAREMTVSEVVALLDRVVNDREVCPAAEEILRRAEPVKFAGVPAGSRARRRDLGEIEEAIRRIEALARKREEADRPVAGETAPAEKNAGETTAGATATVETVDGEAR